MLCLNVGLWMALLNSVRFLMAVRSVVKSFGEETVLQAVTYAASYISCETVRHSDPRKAHCLSVCLSACVSLC